MQKEHITSAGAQCSFLKNQYTKRRSGNTPLRAVQRTSKCLQAGLATESRDSVGTSFARSFPCRHRITPPTRPVTCARPPTARTLPHTQLAHLCAAHAHSLSLHHASSSGNPTMCTKPLLTRPIRAPFVCGPLWIVSIARIACVDAPSPSCADTFSRP